MDIDAQIQHLLTAATPAEATEINIRMNAPAPTDQDAPPEWEMGSGDIPF